MLWIWKAADRRCSASTSILASTQAPWSSAASRSRTGESCLHGPHHSAQKSSTTGTVRDRSMTSVWNEASSTSKTWSPPEAAEPPTCPDWAFARSPDRSTAPGSRMSVGRMLTPTSFPTCLADPEPVDRDHVAVTAGVVLAEQDDPHRVDLVRQALDHPGDAVLRGGRVVVDRRTQATVDVHPRLALGVAADGVPGE